MPYWEARPSDAANLRLFVPGEGWRQSPDTIGADGKTEAQGSRRLIESAFLNALNATNLLVLTGSGSSFAASNPAVAVPPPPAPPPAPKLTPAGMLDLWNAVKAKVGEPTFQAVCDGFADAPIDQNIERLLTLCKLYLELHEKAADDVSKRTKDFVRDAENAILSRVNFVDSDTLLDAHSALITKIGRRGVRKPRAKLFTTNYDLCFEEAARRHRFTIIDGFSHALDQVYDPLHFGHDIVRRELGKEAPDYIENVFHLYKLHGSIDWRRIGPDLVRSRADKGEPVLIYPRSSKYQESFEAPYLDMIGAFQAALREPDTALIVSGFGFNDDHIGRPILSAVETNMSLRLIMCDPTFLTSEALESEEHTIPNGPQSANKFLQAFSRLADSGDARLHLINGRFADMAAALPDLVGETDRERHMARVRALRDNSEGTA
jgi:hypothetical protein